MCGWAVVEAKAFLRLLEIAPDDVHEIVEIDLGIWIERINVVHTNEARRHVPLVRSRALVFLDDVGFRLVVGPEQLLVEIGVAIADRLVGKEA